MSMHDEHANEGRYPEDQIPEAEITPEPSHAVATRPAQPVSTAVDKPPVTSEQAKVEAVASLTMTAYSRASELKLTPEEQAGLQKEFPDEAFRPGAAGKENLLYIEHAFLRDRLNEVLGLGQWSIIPRKRWAEDFVIPASRDRAETPASRVYVEAMLVVRGCFVAEAIGDMVYYKNNQSQNFGDAVEGAKTAALRRCTKELGIGLQAWKKDWCQGWWDRNGNRRPSSAPRQQSGGSQSSAPATAARPTPASAPRPAATAADVAPKPAITAEADKDQRFRFLASLSSNRDAFTPYFVKKGWIKEGQQLEDLPNKYVPTTKKVYDSLMAELQAFVDGDGVTDDEWWKQVVVPFGAQKDIPIGELDKKKLFGWCKNYTVEESYNGVQKTEEQLAPLRRFREALDEAEKKYFSENRD